MDSAVGEGSCERLVDELVLLDQREPVEAATRHGHLEVVAATRSVDDRTLPRFGKSMLEQCLKSV